ncbi:MAG: GNAT family N-acetyltransferase [Clostridia bacterium]|nr:GNAT family N-acetyltransferase [Clostridia bacterium]
MEIKKFSNIRSIKKTFQQLDSQSRPFQKYDLVKNIFSFAYLVEPLLYNAKKFRKYAFYVVYEDGEAILIAPGTVGDQTFYVMGDKEWDYVDLVYKTDDLDKLSQALHFLFVHLEKYEGIKRISWRYLEEKALSYKALLLLQEQGLKLSSKPDLSVNISLDFESHASYFDSLGKSTRQNCRTAYNRLSRDDKQYSLQMFFADNDRNLIDDKKARRLYKKCINLYLKRQKERYHQPIRYRLRNRFYDYATKSIPQKDGFMSVLFIDGEIAAFMLGLQDKIHDSVVVPKLAIVDNYNFYSPGLILINETAKSLIETKRYSNIDLCEGDEKYKYSMGGEEYLTYIIQLDF